MLINSPDCSTCLFSWYRLLIMVGGVGCTHPLRLQPTLPCNWYRLSMVTSFSQTTKKLQPKY